jgi:NIMA (never in mitosis gene a)-related kinase 1/4/5
MADKYTKGQVLGQGSFGRAILVTRKSDGKKFVMKEIDVSRMPRAEKEAAMQEVKVRAGARGESVDRALTEPPPT